MLFQTHNEVGKPPSITPERRQELRIFEKQAGIRFRNLEFLNLAFSHRSYAHETGGSVDNNERLEFLGDSVLGLVVCEYLYRNLFDRNEGELARIKSFVVSENSLETIAKDLKVDNFILIGKGEEYSGGRSKRAILADCMEAIIGALFLDSGFKVARNFTRELIVPEINKVLEDRHQKDYKTLLQELVQKRFRSYPRYRLVHKTGPDHNRTFVVEVQVEGADYGSGEGKTKKEAEQNAAGVAYKVLSEKKKQSPRQHQRPRRQAKG